MKIVVAGLWHLGSVTAVCLAGAGFDVIAYDADKDCIDNFHKGKLPIFEPGLDDLVKEHQGKNLRFTNDPTLISGAKLVWITYDTPVDDNDNADVSFVEKQIENLFPYLEDNSVILISSQMPVGSTSKMAAAFKKNSNKNVSFCCSPENLRLGNAIAVFSKADRIIAGVNTETDKRILEPVFQKFTEKIVWMSVASAEMTKHAINAFLANSVVFINELAVLCEQVGADANEVEAGLKTESRIGPKAYLKPGSSFAGGTLARDITFLINKGDEYDLPSLLFRSIKLSNDHHKSWIKNKLAEVFGEVKNKKIAVLGLTYKPGTDTLRRSGAVELCRWLHEKGAFVKAYDPSIPHMPVELNGIITHTNQLEEAVIGTDAIVVCTEWPVFREENTRLAILASNVPYVIDPNNFLNYLKAASSIRHLIIGKFI